MMPQEHLTSGPPYMVTTDSELESRFQCTKLIVGPPAEVYEHILRLDE